jgi:hypothetical protein
MSQLNKTQLEQENQSSFPNNNNGFITPTLLREFNTDIIDSTVNQGVYNANSQSFSSSIANLQNFSSSLDNAYATDAQLNASSSALTANLNASSSILTANLNASSSVLQSNINLKADISGGNQLVGNQFITGAIYIKSGTSQHQIINGAGNEFTLDAADGEGIVLQADGTLTVSVNDATINSSLNVGDLFIAQQDAQLSGSLNISGSTKIIGNTSITGSLGVSDSLITNGQTNKIK